MQSKNVKLSEVAEVVMGQSPKGTTYNSEGIGIPVLNGPTEFGFSHPTPTTWTNSPTKICKEGDLLFCVRGSTTGRMNWANQKYCIGRGIAAIRSRTPNMDTNYVYYTLVHELSNLLSLCSGSVFPNISKKDLECFEIFWPEETERIGISNLLSSLDQKVELNLQMNSTLEQIAQALFKRWFIDFEFPDENGKPYRSSGGRMVDSELGEIPEGWEVKKLSDICAKVIDGTHDSPKPVEDGYHLVTGKHLSNGFIDFSECYKISAEDHKKVISRSKPERGDILFSNIGTLGSTVLVDQDFEFSIKNIALFKPLENIYSRYLYLHFSSTQTQKLLIQKATGTTQTFFSLKFLRDLELVVPPKSIVSKFDETVQPFFETRSLANQANQSLHDLRDFLLPKLMSGKIWVDC